MTTSEETRMTRTPAPYPSPAEQSVIDRSGIFDAEERVETVARALVAHELCIPVAHVSDRMVTGSDRDRAAAAIAALPPSPAEEAVKRVEGIAKVWDGIADMWRDSAEHPAAAPRAQEMARGEEFDFRERARVLRAALASPAPAPQETEAGRG